MKTEKNKTLINMNWILVLVILFFVLGFTGLTFLFYVGLFTYCTIWINVILIVSIIRRKSVNEKQIFIAAFIPSVVICLLITSIWRGRDRFLIRAVKEDNLEYTNLIIALHPSINYRDTFGDTALFYAIMEDNVQIINKLIGAGANINIVDNDHTTPLILATYKGNGDIIQTLLLHGAEIDAKNHYEQTALHVAVSRNNINAVRILVQHKANIEIKDKFQMTALQYANLNGNKQIINILSSSVHD